MANRYSRSCDCPPDKCSCPLSIVDGRRVHAKPNNIFPTVRMSSDHHVNPSLADIGTKVVLFFEFPPHSLEKRDSFHLLVAGQIKVTRVELIHHRCESGIYKAEVKLENHKDAPIPLQNGQKIKFKYTFRTQYDDNEWGRDESHVTPETSVYFHPIWSDLRRHDKELREDITETLRSEYVQVYILDGALEGKDRSSRLDAPDGPIVEVKQEVTETSPLLSPSRNRASTSLSQETFPVERFYPDSWEVRCWGYLMSPCLRSENKCIKFMNRIFVAPLTNVTVLSLYYQLYLSEIFHTTFLARAGHYGCMPMVNLFIMVALAQFRFAGCYVSDDISVFIFNGAAVFAIFLVLWYTIWGLLQGNPLLGFFMMWPVFFLYLVSNIIFQLIVINSFIVEDQDCWPYTTHAYGYIRWFNTFKLVKWFYQPVLWMSVFAFVQAFSHIAEPMLPPRVNLTAHWMSCSDFIKRNNWGTTLYIFISQAIFGTIDEFLASPRLLPIFMLRLVFTMGYKPSEWIMIQKFVEKCWEFGDPALDFIGTGGADHVDGPSALQEEQDGRLVTYPPLIGPIFEDDEKYHNNVDLMKADLKQMENSLTDQQKEGLKNLELFKTYPHLLTDFVRHYLKLRHRIAKYEIQILAYGPFRNNSQLDNEQAEIDNQRMRRELKNNEGIINFVKQVRYKFWVMEDDLVKGKYVKYV